MPSDIGGVEAVSNCGTEPADFPTGFAAGTAGPTGSGAGPLCATGGVGSGSSSARSNSNPTDDPRRSSSLVNIRTVPYCPSKPAARITRPWRIREIASAMMAEPARWTSSRAACSRMNSSGPRRDTRSSYLRLTVLVLRPTPRISASNSSRATKLRKGAARGGRASGTVWRSASSSTRCITPSVSGLPHSGQRPACFRVSWGEYLTPHLRWPSK